jgi:hypothetical protein
MVVHLTSAAHMMGENDAKEFVAREARMETYGPKKLGFGSGSNAKRRKTKKKEERKGRKKNEKNSQPLAVKMASMLSTA